MIREKFTYANVTSTIAVAAVVAAGAFATAAVVSNDGTINACYAKKSGDLHVLKGKKCGKGEKAISWNQKGQKGEKGDQGPAGAAGTNGANGTNGTNGTNGSNATGLTMGTMTMTSAVTRFTPLSGTGPAGGGAVPAPGITPPVPLTMSNFAVRIDGMIGTESISVTVQVEGADSAMACTVTAPATSCQSAATLNLPPRTLVGIKVISNALGGNRTPSWSWTFTPA
jgi:hypothetical protein